MDRLVQMFYGCIIGGWKKDVCKIGNILTMSKMGHSHMTYNIQLRIDFGYQKTKNNCSTILYYILFYVLNIWTRSSQKL